MGLAPLTTEVDRAARGVVTLPPRAQSRWFNVRVQPDGTGHEVATLATRLAQLELTLLEVVTALGMLVGELALRDDLVLTTPEAVEQALERGWQTLVGVPVEHAPPVAGGPAGARGLRLVEDREPARLAELAPRALSGAMAETGAAVGAIYAVAADSLELLASAGYPQGVMEQFASVPLSADLPVAAVARSRMPLWFAERGEIVDRYPHLLEAHEQTEAAIGQQGVQGAVVPYFVGERVAAVVLVGFGIDAASPDAGRLNAVRQRIERAIDASR